MSISCFCFSIMVVKREMCDVVTKGTLTEGEMLIQMKNLSTSPRNCFTWLGTHLKTRLLVLQQTLYTCIMHKRPLERKIYSLLTFFLVPIICFSVCIYTCLYMYCLFSNNIVYFVPITENFNRN